MAAEEESETMKEMAEEEAVERPCRVLICPEDGCEAQFMRRDKLNRHIRKHLNQKPFLCTEESCGKGFTCRSYLNKHIKRHQAAAKEDLPEEAKPICIYMCPECEKTFKTKFDLKVHAAEHSGVKPFVCDVCDKGFALKGRLRAHLKIHDGYSCPKEGCDHHAATWSALRKHIAAEHTGSASARTCTHCDKIFSTPHNLKVHVDHVHCEPEITFIEIKITDSSETGQQLNDDQRMEVIEEIAQSRAASPDREQLEAKVKKQKITDLKLSPVKETTNKWICPHCTDVVKSYKRKSGLRNHMAAHHSDRAGFKCTATGCKAIFLHAHSLRLHAKRVHHQDDEVPTEDLAKLSADLVLNGSSSSTSSLSTASNHDAEDDSLNGKAQTISVQSTHLLDVNDNRQQPITVQS